MVRDMNNHCMVLAMVLRNKVAFLRKGKGDTDINKLKG